MVLPLMLWAGLVLSQAPDFLDIQPTEGGYQVLAGGGLVYQGGGGGELSLQSELGVPSSALFACARGRHVAVGPRGAVSVSSPQGWRQLSLVGSANLWAVAGSDCEHVLLAGEDGLWRGDVSGDAPVFTRVPLPTRLPLYGVAVERDRAAVVGAGGTVLLRRRASESFTPVSSGTTAPLLAVVLLEGERYVVAGAGGLWKGQGERLGRVHTDESEVFTRVVFADDRVGVVLGQRQVLATTDGGEHWRVLSQATLLGAVSLGGGRFLGVGHGGTWVVLDTAEPERAPTAPLKVNRRLVPEQKSPPKSRQPPASPPPDPVPAPPAPAEPPPPPPPGPECVWTDLEKTRWKDVFLDVRRVGERVLVVGGDGSLRRSEGEGLRVAYKVEDPLLGLAVSAEGRQVAAVGFNVLVRSNDGGKSFRAQRTPTDRPSFAAAFAGERLLLFDADGRAWRSVPDERFEEVPMPRKVTFAAAAFADARRGYVVGTCGTLLETLDGGVSWKALPQPVTTDLQGVVAVEELVYVSGEEGVWRSEDRGRTFRRVLRIPCPRLGNAGRAVAAACSSGQVADALQYAADGIDFQPVPVRYSHGLFAVAVLPEGELYAVGMSEQFIRARPTGGVIAHHSSSMGRWKAMIDESQRVYFQPPPPAPPPRVTVAPLPAR